MSSYTSFRLNIKLVIIKTRSEGYISGTDSSDLINYYLAHSCFHFNSLTLSSIYQTK